MVVKTKTAASATKKTPHAAKRASKKTALIATKKKEKPVAVGAARKKTSSVRKAAKKPSALGLPERMREIALEVLGDRQGEDLLSLDLKGRSALADYAIIASGRSSRQLAAMADHLREAFSKLGVKRVRVEGVGQGDWVVMDAGDVIVHLFRPEVRAYYHIEDIWSVSRPRK